MTKIKEENNLKRSLKDWVKKKIHRKSYDVSTSNNEWPTENTCLFFWSDTTIKKTS